MKDRKTLLPCPISISKMNVLRIFLSSFVRGLKYSVSTFGQKSRTWNWRAEFLFFTFLRSFLFQTNVSQIWRYIITWWVYLVLSHWSFSFDVLGRSLLILTSCSLLKWRDSRLFDELVTWIQFTEVKITKFKWNKLLFFKDFNSVQVNTLIQMEWTIGYCFLSSKYWDSVFKYQKI